MLPDIEIARKAQLEPISEIAHQMGLGSDDFDLYGSPYIAKLRLEALDKLRDRPNARYVLVTAVTPTPLGEGKTTTAIGLGQAFKYLGKRAIVCVRQPSLGPHQRRGGWWWLLADCAYGYL